MKKLTFNIVKGLPIRGVLIEGSFSEIQIEIMEQLDYLSEKAKWMGNPKVNDNSSIKTKKIKSEIKALIHRIDKYGLNMMNYVESKVLKNNPDITYEELIDSIKEEFMFS